MKRNRKWKIPDKVLERQTSCFNSYKNHKLKLKLWIKRALFVLFILSKGNCSNICVLSQCIVYWINLKNKRTFIYQKTLLHALFCLSLKSPKAFGVSIRNQNMQQNEFEKFILVQIISWIFLVPNLKCKHVVWWKLYLVP